MSGFRTGAAGAGAAVTANQGAPNSLANGWPVEVTDGANVLGTVAHPLVVSTAGNTGIVSTANSTTTPLGGGASFTGTSVSVLGYSVIEVLVFADQNSAAPGLWIEFSSDATNWDDSSPFTFTAGGVAPNAGQVFVAAVRGQYARVVYTNGGSAQGTFRLQTVLKTNIVGGDVVSVNAPPVANNHALLTMAQIVGLSTAGGGTYVPVKVGPSGVLNVSSTSQLGSPLSGADTLVAVTGTAVALPSIVPVVGIVVTARQQNTGTGATTLRLGPSTVTATSNGIQLAAGQSVTVPVTNANLLYVNGTSGDGVSVMAV